MTEMLVPYHRTRATKVQRFHAALEVPMMIQKELNDRSFFEFFKYFWKEVSNDELILNWHIEYLCGILQKAAEKVITNEPKENDIIINIPPGSTKTILVSIMWPAWIWTIEHKIRFITSSYSSALSLESADYSRDLIRSDSFIRMYPEIFIKQDKDTKSNFRVSKKIYDTKIRVPVTIRGGSRYSTSVGGTLTGFHGHILIVDDPLDPKRSASTVELAKANRWFSETLSTRKTSKKVSLTVLVMQRLHENDVTGHWLKKRKENKLLHISIPGEIRHYRKHLKPQSLAKYYLNDMFDINRLNWSTLKELESDLGQYGYAGQIGQNPTPPGGGMFKVSKFHFKERIASSEIGQVARYWDKAGTLEAGAYTVGVKMMKLSTGQFLVMDVVRGQWEALQREQIILSTAKADGKDCIIYYEQEPGSGGKESAQATTRMLAGFRAHADRPVGNKVYRADPYSVQVNDGNVLIHPGAWNKAFIDEHEYFPFGQYKDQVDAAAACFNYLSGKKKARVL